MYLSYIMKYGIDIVERLNCLQIKYIHGILLEYKNKYIYSGHYYIEFKCNQHN